MSAGTRVAWPGLNTRLRLRLACCTEGRASRVEDVDGGRLTVAGPDHPCRVGLPMPGTAVALEWLAPNGVHQLGTRVVGTRLRPLYVWVLEPDGVVERIQRRRYVRVPRSGLLLMEQEQQDDDEPAGLLKATLVNLSEGGMGCVAGRSAGIRPGWVLTTNLHLGPDDELRVRVEVVWARTGPEGLVEFGLRFLDLGKRDADRVRRAVFAVQLRLHAQGRR